MPHAGGLSANYLPLLVAVIEENCSYFRNFTPPRTNARDLLTFSWYYWFIGFHERVRFKTEKNVLHRGHEVIVWTIFFQRSRRLWTPWKLTFHDNFILLGSAICSLILFFFDENFFPNARFLDDSSVQNLAIHFVRHFHHSSVQNFLLSPYFLFHSIANYCQIYKLAPHF